MRYGLCCIWVGRPIKFRSTTAKYLLKLGEAERRAYLAKILKDNCAALRESVKACAATGIGSFRITSEFAPRFTQPDVAYDPYGVYPGMVDDAAEIATMASKAGVRLTTHPGQYCVLNSPREEVAAASRAEIIATEKLFSPFGVDVAILHGGGAYGDKPSALKRLREVVAALPDETKRVLCLENDDKTFTPTDLLPVCGATGVPMVYDIHHHRVNKCGMTEREAWEAAMATWDREPLFHISSPLNGWAGKHQQKHHDYIDISDLPEEWVGMDVTVEVEAKRKDDAIKKLMREAVDRSEVKDEHHDLISGSSGV